MLQSAQFFNNESNDQHIFIRNITQNKIKRQTEKENNEFIKQLSNIAIKEMEGLSDYGHKIIGIEEIGNVSRVRH